MSASFGPAPVTSVGPPMHARARATAAGTLTVVQGVQDRKIRLRYVHLSSDANVYAYLTFKSEASDATKRITPAFLATRVPYNANKIGSLIEGPAGDDLQLVTDAAANVDAQVDYDLVE